jgi:hypothetical protein
MQRHVAETPDCRRTLVTTAHPGHLPLPKQTRWHVPRLEPPAASARYPGHGLTLAGFRTPAMRSTQTAVLASRE